MDNNEVKKINENYWKLNIHFRLNREFWKRWESSSALPFRINNLKDLQELLLSLGINNWLYGRTLLDAVTEKKLLEDHDDDIMATIDVTENGKAILEDAIKPYNFEIIRFQPKMISLYRDGRYIDIIPYAGKSHKVEKIRIHGTDLIISSDSTQLLKEKYGTDFLNYRAREKKNKISILSNIKMQVLIVSKKIKQNLSLKNKKPIKKTKLLSEKDFLNTKIDRDDAINWEWRKNHINKVFLKGETLGEALNRIKNLGGIEYLQKDIIEVDTSKGFPEPINLSYKFWREGNNFFVNPVLYGFRHLVMPYSGANLYITSSLNNKAFLYTKKYYLGLPKMSDDEIAEFVQKHPVEIQKGGFTSGRHRVCAMFGRLLRGDKYIPMLSLVID
jgi:hypothetical protein